MQSIWKQPNLLLGLVSFVTLILSVGLRANGLKTTGDDLLYTTFALGFIHWVWASIDVLKHYHSDKKTENRTIIWVIIVLIVPPIGGILYYAFHQNLNL